MDTTDRQLREELERRLAVIGAAEAADPAHDPLPRADLTVMAAIVAVSVLLGVVVGL